MTTEEAKCKECRHFAMLSQIWIPVAGAIRRDTEVIQVPSPCSADACMAWRWFDTAIKSEGYCGLCGKEGAE